MNIDRRTLLAGLAASVGTTDRGLSAEVYPSRPVRMLVPFAAGGGIDLLARLTAQELTDRLGQSFVIENVTGGGGVIASNMIANANPDGYTIIFQSSSSAAVVPATSQNLRYDPIAAFAPVSLVGELPLVLVVNKDLPVNTLSDFIEFLRRNGGKMSYGTAGPNTAIHLVTELFRLTAAVDILHIPYRGMSPATQDVLAGTIAMVFDSVPAQVGNINSGAVKALAVTSAKRSDVLPNVPTMAESGLPQVTFNFWGAIFAPSATDTAIVDKLSTTVRAGLMSNATSNRLRDFGIVPIGSTPAELDRYWRSEIELYRKIVADTGLKLN